MCSGRNSAPEWQTQLKHDPLHRYFYYVFELIIVETEERLETFYICLQVPNHDVSGERSVQVESTCPAGQGSAYPPTAPNSGLSDSWKYKSNMGFIETIVATSDLLALVLFYLVHGILSFFWNNPKGSNNHENISNILCIHFTTAAL